MSRLPIFLDLTARRCVVVGGGPVAARKVDALLAAGADVTVVAPALTARLALRTADRRVRWIPREYRAGDLDDADLAFATTGDERVNDAVARDARAQRVWVNAADDPARCDFYLSAVVRRGPLTVAIGTAGTSPALARVVREELEEFLTADYATLAELAADVRRELRARSVSPDGDAWAAAIRRADVRAFIASGRLDEAREALRAALCERATPMSPVATSNAAGRTMDSTLGADTARPGRSIEALAVLSSEPARRPGTHGPAATREAHAAGRFAGRPAVPEAPLRPPTGTPPPTPRGTTVAREGRPRA